MTPGPQVQVPSAHFTVPAQAWGKGRAEAPAYGTSALIFLLFLRQHDGQRQEPKSLKFNSNISGGGVLGGTAGSILCFHPWCVCGQRAGQWPEGGVAGCPQPAACQALPPSSPAVSREAPSGVDWRFPESAVASGIPFLSKPCPPGQGPRLGGRLPFWHTLAVCIV